MFNALHCPQLLSPSLRGGLLSLDPVVERLRQLLPPRFEDLEREFAVGVVDAQVSGMQLT